ncbi:MAG: hypothetical protein JW884_14395 [Deltaproteobacteria bacterium]|nr:hypothetical protein [Deltaproteobacteria bacterium]
MNRLMMKLIGWPSVAIILFLTAGCAGQAETIKKPKEAVAVSQGATESRPQKKATLKAEEEPARSAAAILPESKRPDGAKSKKEKLIDESGEYEIIPTPFGYVKKRIKEPLPSKETEKPPAAAPVEAKAPEKAPSEPPAPPQAPEPPQQPLASASTAGAVKKAASLGDIVTFNFDDADLYEVIRTMSDLLKLNIIFDVPVKGKVTIHTAGGIRKEYLSTLFYQILEANGLTAVKEGELHRIVKMKEASRLSLSFNVGKKAEDLPAEDKVILQIVPLQYIAATEMTKLLTPFISTEGTMVVHETSNTLLVVDKGLNIFKILKLVEVFDVNLFDKICHRFYPLEFMVADDAAKVLREVVAPYATGRKDEVKFIAIERLNTLVVISSNPLIFDKMDFFVRQLDVPGGQVEPQIYVYSVQNGMAAQLSTLLNAIFGAQTTKDVKGSKKEARPTNPLSREAAAEKPKEGAKASEATVQETLSTTGGASSIKGTVTITADEVRNALIIEAVPRDYFIIEKILKRLDVMPRQVLIEATVAEVTLTEGTELGVEWTFKKDPWTSTGSLNASIGAAGLQYAIGLSSRWQTAISALADQKKVNILSSPHILASDNKEARIDISTEIPVASTEYQIQTNADPLIETNIQYRDTGLILVVTPHINENGLVTMDIKQEVSETSANVSVGGKDYPSFFKRAVNTTLTVKHGQTLVIGGLIKETKSDDAKGLPCLINIPVLRYLAGKEKKGTDKTELIIMITPRVIASVDDVDAVTEEFKSKVSNISKQFEAVSDLKSNKM